MRVLYRIVSMFVFASKRLFSQFGMVVANLLGLVSSATLVVSIPLYVDAIYYRTLREELSATVVQHQSPFIFMFHHIGSVAGSLPWDDIQAADGYLSGPVASDLGLPLELAVRFLRTDHLLLFPRDTISYEDHHTALASIRFGFASGLGEHITIVEGDFPAVASLSPESAVDVLLSKALAEETGIEIGETYVAFTSEESKNGHGSQVNHARLSEAVKLMDTA